MAMDPFLATSPVRRVVAVNESGNYAGSIRKPDWANGQIVAIGAASARSAAVTATEVVITCSTGAWVKFGTVGVVTASHGGAGCMYLREGGPYYFQFTSGQAIAVIHSSGTGHLSVHPVL